MASLSGELLYIIWAGGLALISFVVIDRERYRGLFFYGLVGGFLASSVFIGVMTAVGGFHYENFGSMHFFRIPIFITLAWIPAIMLFLHFMPGVGPVYYWLYLLSWVLLSSMIQRGLEYKGLMIRGWFNEGIRAVFSLVWYYVVSQWYLWMIDKSE